MNRRQFNTLVSATMAGVALAQSAQPAGSRRVWKPNYMLASCLYGYQYVGEILPEVSKVGATAIDLWPKVHGNQREQVDDLGVEKFQEMMQQHNVILGCITQYKLGPFALQDECRFARQFDCKTIVTGASWPANLTGKDLKSAIGNFLEKMKPHVAVAEECGVTIAIENHSNSLINSPDSMKWLAELSPTGNPGIAFAPYHLPQDDPLLAGLITDLAASIKVFYAWQHGNGCSTRLPKEQELLQMPGRGDLDFKPLVKALDEINYAGWVEIFMHPFPRGISILESTGEVTAEVNRARSYLESLTDA